MNKTENKKRDIVNRFRNRNSLPVFPDKHAQDTYIIDTTLAELYNEGDKVAKSLDKDILKQHRIRISEQEYERIWEILTSTGLVNAVIGFGNNGKLNLTNEGYQLMRQFGSYSAFLTEREKSQQQPGIVMPQFIIAEEQEPAKEEGKPEEKQAAADAQKPKEGNK